MAHLNVGALQPPPPAATDRVAAPETHQDPDAQGHYPPLRVGALFAGYGGLDLAAERVFGARTAWVSEFDKAPSRILAQRFPDAPNLGDVTAIDWHRVPAVDVITGGSPCQDLSHPATRARTLARTPPALHHHPQARTHPAHGPPRGRPTVTRRGADRAADRRHHRPTPVHRPHLGQGRRPPRLDRPVRRPVHTPWTGLPHAL